jgi:CubicO group peptidase (beta-lactamase class C family)
MHGGWSVSLQDLLLLPLILSLPEYLKGVAQEGQIFNAGYTPVYSNEAFALLGFALSKITGQSMEAMFNASLAEALNLPGTFYKAPVPSTDNDVIPGPVLAITNWETDLGKIISPTLLQTC